MAGLPGAACGRPPPARLVSLLGPAVVASVAYVDPGNFATNLQGGAEFGYLLVWVVVLSSLVAMLVQYLAAKLGIATGRGLAELCGERLGRRGRLLFWVQAELVAVATDLAEVLGTAIGLHLLLGLSLGVCGVLAGGLAFAVLQARRRGYRAFELTIGVLVAVVVTAFLYETARARPNAAAALAGLAPRLAGHESLLLAIGIVGATIMPHALYLHSSLATERFATGGAGRRRLLVGQRLDVLGALGVAGAANLAMLLLAAAALRHGAGALTITAAHGEIGRLLGGSAALVFALALLSSGLGSAAVGTYAGQVVMQSLTGWKVPIWLRRLVTVAPAVSVLEAGVGATRALVLSQVVLAFGLPFALLPLVVLTSRRSLMGAAANPPVLTVVAGAVALTVIALDAWLVLGG